MYARFLSGRQPRRERRTGPFDGRFDRILVGGWFNSRCRIVYRRMLCESLGPSPGAGYAETARNHL